MTQKKCKILQFKLVFPVKKFPKNRILIEHISLINRVHMVELYLKLTRHFGGKSAYLRSAIIEFVSTSEKSFKKKKIIKIKC